MRRSSRLSAVPAAAFPLYQLMLGHLDTHRWQVKHLAAFHRGHRPVRQGGTAAGTTSRLMAHLPVRACCLHQRRALMPILAAGLAAGLPPQRPLPRRLAQTLARRWPGRVPWRLPKPGLQLSDPLPCPCQLRPRLSQLRAQRLHQRGKHVIWRRALITGHTRTLRPKITRRTDSITSGVSNQLRSVTTQPNRPDQLR